MNPMTPSGQEATSRKSDSDTKVPIYTVLYGDMPLDLSLSDMLKKAIPGGIM